MGGEHDADPLLLEPGHHGPDGQAALGVDARRGLVEKGHLGPADQGQGEGEALLLAAGEVPPRGGGHGAQPDQLEQVLGGHGVGVVAGEELQDPAWAEHGVDATALEHHPDAPGQRPVLCPGVEPEDAHRSGVGPAVALEALDRRRLAGAVGTEDDQDLPGLGHQVDPVDGRGGGGAVAHREAADLDCGHGAADYFLSK